MSFHKALKTVISEPVLSKASILLLKNHATFLVFKTKVTQPLKATLRAMPTMFAPVLDIKNWSGSNLKTLKLRK
jgi:hypothetical protein